MSTNKNLSIVNVGDIIKNCKVVAEDEKHYFLELEIRKYYDIVMLKKELQKKYEIGNVIDVVIDCINIAGDGTPGAFVKPYIV